MLYSYENQHRPWLLETFKLLTTRFTVFKWINQRDETKLLTAHEKLKSKWKFIDRCETVRFIVDIHVWIDEDTTGINLQYDFVLLKCQRVSMPIFYHAGRGQCTEKSVFGGSLMSDKWTYSDECIRNALVRWIKVKQLVENIPDCATFECSLKASFTCIGFEWIFRWDDWWS